MKEQQIWCYIIDCPHNCYNGTGEDKDGKFGSCAKEILIIDKEGRCNGKDQA